MYNTHIHVHVCMHTHTHTLSLTAWVKVTYESNSSWGVLEYWSGLVLMNVPVSFNLLHSSDTLAAWGERESVCVVQCEDVSVCVCVCVCVCV